MTASLPATGWSTTCPGRRSRIKYDINERTLPQDHGRVAARERGQHQRGRCDRRTVGDLAGLRGADRAPARATGARPGELERRARVRAADHDDPAGEAALLQEAKMLPKNLGTLKHVVEIMHLVDRVMYVLGRIERGEIKPVRGEARATRAAAPGNRRATRPRTSSCPTSGRRRQAAGRMSGIGASIPGGRGVVHRRCFVSALEGDVARRQNERVPFLPWSLRIHEPKTGSSRLRPLPVPARALLGRVRLRHSRAHQEGDPAWRVGVADPLADVLRGHEGLDELPAVPEGEAATQVQRPADQAADPQERVPLLEGALRLRQQQGLEADRQRLRQLRRVAEQGRGGLGGRRRARDGRVRPDRAAEHPRRRAANHRLPSTG